ALHQGHLSLMQQSMSDNDATVVSIFVNPTQFNNPEDLAKYPRTLEDDLNKISGLCTEIIVYAPPTEDLYEGKPSSLLFDFDGLENQMEGEFRPGHFNGVGTVVRKLFKIVQPTNAYFGEKDFQQLQIIKKMVEKLKLNVNIVGCPIFRENNGLAMSSRNERLSVEDRNKASLIYKTLLSAKELFGTKTANEVSNYVNNVFKNQSKFELEYFEIADEQTLKTCKRKSETKNYRAFIAVFINNVRLIDTISV
ncbi:pantoate--beta-alanine ligase, partial [Flavobacterium sp.]|uniref:pantoate--beta-alanine ligase n=1 Tax=Flavobacterium sp. TaxID=239 RepID=UPI0037522EB9